MKFTDAAIDAMLQATGEQIILEDGTLPGLSLWGKRLDPQTMVGEFDMRVELTDPSCKVRTSAIIDLINAPGGLRGKRVVFDDGDYTVKTFDVRRSGLTVLSLEEAD